MRLRLRIEESVTSGQDGVHAQGADEKRPAIGGFVDDLARRLAGAVPGFGLDLNEHGTGACLNGLQRSRELERMTRHDPVVVIGGRDQRGGVGDPGAQLVQRDQPV